MKSLVFPLGALLVFAIPALAQNDTVYTSRSDFNAATTGTSVVTFEDVAVPAKGFITHTNPFTLDGVAFHATSDSHFNVTSPTYYSSQSGGTASPYTNGNYLATALNPGATDVTDNVTITFPAATAFGFDYGGLFDSSFISVTLSDGFTSGNFTPSSITGTSSLDFIGFTTDTPITFADLSMSDAPNFNALDNLTYGSAAITPEPSSIALVLTGLGAAASSFRRRFIR